jgi:pyruvate dehydrogenase E1 component
MIWAAGDMQTRGFLLGATAGRTTLAGEGLQHQDGHSHMLAYPNPSVLAYDPAFAYEVAVIVREGLHRMLENGESLVYYLTIMNEFYAMPDMPDGVEEGILKGLYKFRAASKKRSTFKAHLLGSGAILNEALKAQEILETRFNVPADVWSLTSYKNLYWDAIETERWNWLNADKKPKTSFIEQQTAKEQGVFIAVSDYLKAMPSTIAKYLPGPVTLLGTDGYGRSDTRAALRDFFEVDARHIAFAALSAMARQGKIEMATIGKARKQLDIDPKRANPLFC